MGETLADSTPGVAAAMQCPLATIPASLTPRLTRVHIETLLARPPPDSALSLALRRDDHVVAITESGAVYSWGNGQQGQLGRVGERLSEGRRLETFLTPSRVMLRGTRGKRIADVACGSYSTFFVFTGGLRRCQ